jgi:membrane protein
MLLERERDWVNSSLHARHGWPAILKATFRGFGDRRIMSVAAGVTFYVLLAIFPALAALISIYGFIADPGQIWSHVNSMSDVLPGGMTQVLGEQMKRLATQDRSALSIGFVVGVVVALWSASSGMKALFDALNVVYGEAERRGFLKLSGIALLFTLGSMVFLLLALGAVVVVPIVIGFVGLQSQSAMILTVARWPALFVVMAFGLAILYRFGPSRPEQPLRLVGWGNVSAALLWVGGSLLFSWYVASFGSYNKTYGSLGAVIGFMTWIWLSTMIILLGADLDAAIADDTRPGPAPNGP